MNKIGLATEDLKKSYSGKPFQAVSYADKVADDGEWGKGTMKYFIDQALFGRFNSGVDSFTNKSQLYDAYNNKIPQELFDYVSDPFKSLDNEKAKAQFKGFPAKIRPYNILRPNIDLLIGEWVKRPFLYDVTNADGEDAFNSFVEHKTKTFIDNLSQRFINTINELAEGEGQSTGVPSEEIPDPKTVISDLNVKYKDVKALNGYRALRTIELENKLREVWRKLFKDWLIAGECYTFKIPLHGDIEYMRLSPLWVEYDKSAMSPYIEDGDYAVAKFRMTVSEFTELFYDQIDREDIHRAENETGVGYSNRLFNTFVTSKGDGEVKDHANKVDVYYCVWKSKKKIGFLTYKDPFSGLPQYDIVDEDYKPDAEAGESVEWMWVNEAYHGWRYGEDRYFGIEAVPAQRNEMNNFSACKLTINGKRFSDTESENISCMWLGMPYQIMYIVLMYRLELTIAKSKGKIALLDKGVIPDEDDGGEEGFFWYSEALGYALIDRSPDNEEFDRTMNQYQVLDMDLFQYIKELIEITNYMKAQWDELLGITRQRKGQNTSSDGLGVTEEAIFRSSVISEIIFTGFEEFLQTELTGLLDISKYAWADGKKSYWRNDDSRMEMLAIEPEDYVNSEYNVFVQNMSMYLDKINLMKQQINAIAQRKDVKPSAIVDLLFTDSVTEIRAKLKKAEAIELEIARRAAKDEADAQQQQQEILQAYKLMDHRLELDTMHQKEDRLDNREYIKAEVQNAAATGETLDVVALETESGKRMERLQKQQIENRKLDNDQEWMRIEREKIKSNEKIAKEDNKVKLKNKVAGEK